MRGTPTVISPPCIKPLPVAGKVNACVGHAVELYMLLMARWLRNGETLSVDDLIELSYRYSREIEHSDENLEQVEVLDWFGL